MREYIIRRNTTAKEIAMLEAAHMTKEKFDDHFCDELMLLNEVGDCYAINSRHGLIRMDWGRQHQAVSGNPKNEIESYFFQAKHFLYESSFFDQVVSVSSYKFRERIYLWAILILLIACVIMYAD